MKKHDIFLRKFVFYLSLHFNTHNKGFRKDLINDILTTFQIDIQMIIKRTLALAILLAFAGTMLAKLNLPTKKLGNEMYYYYEVKNNNETLADISNKIGVSKEDIIKFNPTAKSGVAKKQLLFFPVSDFDKKAAPERKVNPSALNNTVTHLVKSGESVYGIAKAYNVTQQQLLDLNPSIANGLKAGQEILIPQQASINNEGIIYHTIKSGETLYGVAKTYNTSIEKLMELNPGISGTNFRANDVIKVLPNSTKDIVVTRNIKQFVPYKVEKGDTYQSIAKAHNMDPKTLKELNPEITDKNIKKGDIIYLPQYTSEQQTVNTSQLSEQQLEENYKDKLDEVYNDVHVTNKDNSIDISLILPFQLQSSNPSVYATPYREFFNGLVIGLKSIEDKVKGPLNLNVYDTNDNMASTDSILSLPELKKSDVIIAPSESEQLQKIMRYGKNNNINVLNCFATHNDDYINNAWAMQVNIPSDYMNAAINTMLDNDFKDYVLVYLVDSQDATKEIFESIKSHAQAAKHPSKSINIDTDLTAKGITKHLEPGSSYLFIPSNGSESFLNRIAQGLKEAKDLRVDCDIVMLGYPEYTMYIKKHKEEFMAIDTYIYSRFYLPDNEESEAFFNNYNSIYGNKPSNSTPNMSVFGYDTSLFLANALINNYELGSKESKYKGIQTDFNFERANNWAGYINKSVRIIHLTPKKELIITDLND